MLTALRWITSGYNNLLLKIENPVGQPAGFFCFGAPSSYNPRPVRSNAAKTNLSSLLLRLLGAAIFWLRSPNPAFSPEKLVLIDILFLGLGGVNSFTERLAFCWAGWYVDL